MEALGVRNHDLPTEVRVRQLSQRGGHTACLRGCKEWRYYWAEDVNSPTARYSRARDVLSGVSWMIIQGELRDGGVGTAARDYHPARTWLGFVHSGEYLLRRGNLSSMIISVYRVHGERLERRREGIVSKGVDGELDLQERSIPDRLMDVTLSLDGGGEV